jgi:long-chain acyl-CoA synthetase
MVLGHRTLGRSEEPSTSEATYWVFDIDGSLVDSLSGTSLRPGARALLTHLVARDQPVLFWSAGGQQYAERRAAQFDLESLVDACFAKEGRDELGFYITSHLALGSSPAIFVDDRPEDLSPGLTVVAVRPYLADDPHDRGLEAVSRLAGLATSVNAGLQTGQS